MSLDIKKNDTVLVIAGDDKGKRGRIVDVMPGPGRVMVESVNIVKKHMKPNKNMQQGGIIEREAPVNRSNVMLICPKCDKPTKTGNNILENGKKIRLCKQCGEVVE